jgi:hypothetical protein
MQELAEEIEKNPNLNIGATRDKMAMKRTDK